MISSSCIAILGAPLILLAVPALSLEVAMEFVGRVDMLGAAEVDLLEDIFLMTYNDDEAWGNGNTIRRFVTSVEIVSYDVESNLLAEESASQPFTLKADVACDGCNYNSLFSNSNGFGDSDTFGLDIDVFVSRFNDLATAMAGTTSVESLSAIQQIEAVSCPAADENTNEADVGINYKLAEGGVVSDEEVIILEQAFLDTYNFLNAASTSQRCDDSFRRVESVLDDTDERRELIGGLGNRIRGFGRFHYRVRFKCNACPRDIPLLTNEAGRRRQMKKDLKMENNTERERKEGQSSARTLSSGGGDCSCSVQANEFGPMSSSEFVSAFSDTIQLLREQGLITSVEGVEEMAAEVVP